MTVLNNEYIMFQILIIDTTPFLNCKQIVDYKMNLLSRMEYKC